MVAADSPPASLPSSANVRTHSPSGLYDKTVLVLLCELAGGADDLVDPTS